MSKQEGKLLRLAQSSAEFVVGVDEVGLGAWAGPLVVAAVVVPRGWSHPDVKDSKAYKHSRGYTITAHTKRVRAEFEVQNSAKMVQVRSATSTEIDASGVNDVLMRLTRSAVRSCVVHYPNSIVVLDGNIKLSEFGDGNLFDEAEFMSMPKADALVPAVSAASVVAKVYRDSWMHRLHEQYPGYGFKRNAGYGTQQHRDAIRQIGLCPQHRRSYKPIVAAESGRL